MVSISVQLALGERVSGVSGLKVIGRTQLSDQAEALALFVLCPHILYQLLGLPNSTRTSLVSEEYRLCERRKQRVEASWILCRFSSKRGELQSTLPHHRFSVVRLRF